MSSNTVRSTPAIGTMMAHASVRAFTDEPIDEGLLVHLVTAGTRASTSSNMQAYSVISVTDAGLKKAIAGLCADQAQIHQSAAFLVFCADLHKMMLACERHDTEPDPAGQAEVLMVAVIDTALVMQNVATAAESVGLGICMIGAMRNHPYDVAEALHLPDHVIALAGMCIGHPAEQPEVKPRFPLDAALHHNRYRSDEELTTLIQRYDESQAKWYADRDMHVRDPRWSAVISRRLPKLANRAAVDTFLRERGFLSK